MYLLPGHLARLPTTLAQTAIYPQLVFPRARTVLPTGRAKLGRQSPCYPETKRLGLRDNR
jgi:hypothetical protein